MKTEQRTPLTPRTSVSSEGVKVDDLTISFKRTIRVPDNNNANDLPPEEADFPLFRTDKYAERLPSKMAQKGGIFLPMYQREAMWISFESEKRYAIKIFVGNVNAISGEPKVETAATQLRRRNALKHGNSIQDYLVVPDQTWIDGAAVEPGKVRQFVAMPIGTGTSIEAQMTGEETTAGLEFKIVRLDTLHTGPKDNINILVKSLSGLATFFVSRFSKVRELKHLIQSKVGVPFVQQNLVWDTNPLESRPYVYHNQLLSTSIKNGTDYEIDETRLCDCGMTNASIVHLFARLRGGNAIVQDPEMNLAAGGLINQIIVPLPQLDFKKSAPVTLDVQILNCASFQRVTRQEPPETPISAETYARAGYPFFSMYEGPTTISGDFSDLESLAQLEGRSELDVSGIPIVDVETREVLRKWVCKSCRTRNMTGMQQCKSCKQRRPKFTTLEKVGILNPDGPKTPFKLLGRLLTTSTKSSHCFEDLTA